MWTAAPSLPFDGVTRGELCVKGPQVMQGYWQRPDHTAEAIDAEGWLHTGDICTVDSEGYFFIVDRLKDLMIASGYKVLPREVEEVLFKHPKIADCAVAGVKNAARGDDTITAFVVVKPGETLTADEVKEFCKANWRRTRCRAKCASVMNCPRRWWAKRCAANWWLKN